MKKHFKKSKLYGFIVHYFGINMRKKTLDLEALRTFVTGIELDSFAKAAEQLNRSTSAVSVHLKKIEGQIGQDIVARSGRGLSLTPVGEQLFAYAKRLLMLNDETILSLSQHKMSGKVSIGLQEDFGEHFLASALGVFSRAFPEVEIEVKVARNPSLQDALRSGKLDFAWLWAQESHIENSEKIATFPMIWVGSREYLNVHPGKELPLVMFDSPCLLRSVAIGVLNEHQLSWRQIMSSHSLAGIWSAVRAGLGITVRTEVGLPSYLKVMKESLLPDLPTLSLYAIFSQSPSSPTIIALHNILKEELIKQFPHYVESDRAVSFNCE